MICLFALIVSSLIDTNTCPQGILKIFCGMYPNRTYGFAYLTGLRRVVERVPVRCNCLLILINCFLPWSRISFKFFSKEFIYLLLTCVFFIYWIIIHWYWNLYLVVIINFLWDASKPDIRICFPFRFVEGCGKGVSFVAVLFIINWPTGFNSIIPNFPC